MFFAKRTSASPPVLSASVISRAHLASAGTELSAPPSNAVAPLASCLSKSDGFVLYERFSGGLLGSRGQTYRVFLERIFDELAVDLGTLFDPLTPQSLIFPGERCLELGFSTSRN